MKTNKYNYLKVIQQNYGQGWEDVSEYPQKKSVPSREEIDFLRKDFKEYQLLGYPTKIINRKELKEIVLNEFELQAIKDQQEHENNMYNPKRTNY